MVKNEDVPYSSSAVPKAVRAAAATARAAAATVRASTVPPYSSYAVANAVRAAAATVRASTVPPYSSYAVANAVRAAAAAVRAPTVDPIYPSYAVAAAVANAVRARRSRRAADDARRRRAAAPRPPSPAEIVEIYEMSEEDLLDGEIVVVRAGSPAADATGGIRLPCTSAPSSSRAPTELNRFAILALLADDGEFSHLSGMTSTNTAASFANPPIFDDFDINLPSTDASPKKTLFGNGEASATTFINKLGKVTPEFVDVQKGPEGVQVTGEDDDGYAVVRSRKYGMLRGKYPEGPHVDSSVDVCHNEIPFATIVGSRRKVRKCFQSRKGGRARSYMGLGFYVFGSYGPDSLEF